MCGGIVWQWRDIFVVDVFESEGNLLFGEWGELCADDSYGGYC